MPKKSCVWEFQPDKENGTATKQHQLVEAIYKAPSPPIKDEKHIKKVDLTKKGKGEKEKNIRNNSFILPIEITTLLQNLTSDQIQPDGNIFESISTLLSFFSQLNLAKVEFSNQTIQQLNILSERYHHEILSLINEISPAQLNSGLTAIIIILIKQGHAKEVVDKFPNQIDWKEIDNNFHQIFSQLYLQSQQNLFIEKLASTITWNAISTNNFFTIFSYLQIVNFSWENFFPQQITWEEINCDVIKLFKLIIESFSDGSEKICSLLPQKISWQEINTDIESFFNSLITFNCGQKILEKLPPKISSTELSDSISKIFDGLIYQKFQNEILAILSEYQRLPINPTEIKDEYLTKIMGLNIWQVLSDLPIDINMIIDMTGAIDRQKGWKKAKLIKSGSQTTLYFTTNSSGQLQIVFFNHSIKPEAIATYLKASKFLPHFIASCRYFELDHKDDQRPTTLAYPYAIREVFAGPSLAQIKLDELPPSIKKSILSQQRYIKLMLHANGINFGRTHDHNGNFNVRFLLEKNGQKIISLDIHEAIKLAKEKNMTLTPIVILRDWDRAESQNPT